MGNTPQIGPRVAPELIDAARTGIGQPDASVAVLVRAGLAVLAGMTVLDALRMAQSQTRPGPKPRTG